MGGNSRINRYLKEHNDDPKPFVLFTGFGDNALALELRVYLPSMDQWFNTRTALHDAIYYKFEQAKIAIAFPQRDLHLKTVAPGTG